MLKEIIIQIYLYQNKNRIIEVKSTWTFQKENVLMRQSFGKHLGYKYEIWVYDKKGNKTCYD